MTVEPVNTFSVYIRDNWSTDWTLATDLDVVRVEAGLAPTVDRAIFLFRYGRVGDNEGNFANVARKSLGLVGYYVKVLIDTTIVFTGRFADSSDSIGGAYPDPVGTGDQTLIAYGLERTLQQCAVNGSYVEINGAAVLIPTRLPFNIPHRTSTAIGGNRSAAKVGASYIFSASSGAAWTARDVAEYLLARFVPHTSVGTPTFSLADNVGAANLAKIVDAWECPDTVAAGLSRLANRHRGHTWRITCTGEMPVVEPISLLDVPITIGSTTLAANPYSSSMGANTENIPTNGLVVRESGDAYFDQIEVVGAPLWVCGAVKLVPAWSAAEAAAYDAANEEARAQDALRHVYQAYRIAVSSDGKPFVNAAGVYLPVPSVDADGSLNYSTPSPLFACGRSLTRETPLRAGYTYSTGVETPPAATGVPMEWLPPIVYASVTAGETTTIAPIDKLNAIDSNAPSVSVHVLDGDLGLRLQCPAGWGHLLAKNHGTRTNDPADKPAAFDYDTDLVATAAIRADACLKLTWSGTPPIAKTLTLRVPDAECWVILEDTPLTVTAGAVVRAPTNIVTRTDITRLEAVLAAARAWYGRDRRAITRTLRDLSKSWSPGTLLTNLVTATEELAINTVVTQIVWDGPSASTTVETDFTELDAVAITSARPLAPGPAWNSVDARREPNLPVRLALPAMGKTISYGVTTQAHCFIDHPAGSFTLAVHPCSNLDGDDVDESVTIALTLFSPASGSGSGRHLYRWSDGVVIPYIATGPDTGLALPLNDTPVWARVTADWVAGSNTVTVRLCDIGTDPPTEIPVDMTCYLFSPHSLTGIQGVTLAANDLIPVTVAVDASIGEGGAYFAHAVNVAGGPGAVGTHALLDGEVHTDTAEVAPTAGDLVTAVVVGEATVWTALAAGAADSLMVIDSGTGLPAWFAPAASESILTTSAAGALTWLADGAAGSLLSISGAGALSWLAGGAAGKVLTMVGGVPAWADGSSSASHALLSATHTDSTPAAVQQGDLITGHGASPTWTRLGIGDLGAVMIAGNEPTWMSPPETPGLLYSDGEGLDGWFLAGASQSICISDASGDFSWLAKGSNGALLYIDGDGVLNWVGTGTTGQVLTWSGGVPTWATPAAASGAPVVGEIRMWGLDLEDIPTGWALCDGNAHNGIQTPNLVGRFPIGYDGDSVPATGTGGSASHSHDGGAHGHTPVASEYGNLASGTDVWIDQSGGQHSHSATSHMPPWTRLIFIMYVGT